MRKTLQNIITATTITAGSLFANNTHAQLPDFQTQKPKYSTQKQNEQTTATLSVYTTQTQLNTTHTPYQGKPAQKQIYEKEDNITTKMDRAITSQEIDTILKQENLTESSDTITIVRKATRSKPGEVTIGFAYLNLGYQNIPEKYRDRIPLNEQFLTEDTANTHIYLSLPQGTNISQTREKIYVIDTKTKRLEEIPGVPSNETRLYEFVTQINKRLDENKQKNTQKDLVTITREQIRKLTPQARNEYEKLLNTGIQELGGLTGLMVEATKEGMVITLDKKEQQRQEAISIPTQTLYKIPFHETNQNPFSQLVLGREIQVKINTKHAAENQEVTVIVPQITFHSQSNQIDARTNFSLENITQEIVTQKEPNMTPESCIAFLQGTWIPIRKKHVDKTEEFMRFTNNTTKQTYVKPLPQGKKSTPEVKYHINVRDNGTFYINANHWDASHGVMPLSQNVFQTEILYLQREQLIPETIIPFSNTDFNGEWYGESGNIDVQMNVTNKTIDGKMQDRTKNRTYPINITRDGERSIGNLRVYFHKGRENSMICIAPISSDEIFVPSQDINTGRITPLENIILKKQD